MERTTHSKCSMCRAGEAYIRAVSVRGSRRWHTYVCDDCAHTWMVEDRMYDSQPPILGLGVVIARKPDRRSTPRST